jgi:hypothetical protein
MAVRILLIVAFLSLAVLPGLAQDEPVYHSSTRTLTMFPDIENLGSTDVEHVYLWVTRDDGNTWTLAKDADVSKKNGEWMVRYNASEDGRYGFRSQAKKTVSITEDPPQAGTRPDLFAVVDTIAPIFSITTPNVGDTWESPITIAWEMTDANPFNVELQVRAPGQTWATVWTDTTMSGSREYTPAGEGEFHLRMRGRDKAGNTTQSKTLIFVPGEPIRLDGTISQPVQGEQVMVPAATRNRKFEVNYNVTGIDPSGLAEVRLWYKRNQEEWRYYGAHAAGTEYPFVFHAKQDGVYGFWLTAHSNAGIQYRHDPGAGDAPMMTTLIDTVRPALCIVDPVESDAWVAGRVERIAWSLDEEHMGDAPIEILYQMKGQTGWTEITQVDNSVREYGWQIPAVASGLVRVMVRTMDLAGNVGESHPSKEMILISGDYSPEIQIGIERFEGRSVDNGGTAHSSEGTNPAVSPIRSRERARVHAERGIFFRNQKQYDRAVEEYHRAIQLDPEFVNAILDLGVIYGQIRSGLPEMPVSISTLPAYTS